MRKRGAAFDLDGTLADTSADLIGGANAVLAEAGRSGRLDPAKDAGTAGKGGRAMLRLGLERSGGAVEEAEVDALYTPFLAAYEARIAEATRLFPGVERCLDKLEAEGWILSVCTNKPERLAHVLLEALGVHHRFRAILGPDSLPVRKPDPQHLWETLDRSGADRDAAILVGDTITDRKTAEAAGVPCILMNFGLSADNPRTLSAAAVVSDYAMLPPIMGMLVKP